MYDMATYDKLYEECLSRFADKGNVKVIRAETIAAIDEIQPKTGIEKFDLVYIEANHQYKYILRHLMHYQELVTEDGFILLNDCCKA